MLTIILPTFRGPGISLKPLQVSRWVSRPQSRWSRRRFGLLQGTGAVGLRFGVLNPQVSFKVCGVAGYRRRIYIGFRELLSRSCGHVALCCELHFGFRSSDTLKLKGAGVGREPGWMSRQSCKTRKKSHRQALVVIKPPFNPTETT